MTVVAIMYLLAFASVVAGVAASPGRTINGHGWALTVTVLFACGLTLALGVIL